MHDNTHVAALVRSVRRHYIIHAGPCLSGLLSGYLGGSCTLSGVVFDNWSYAPGATGVSATSIN